MTEREKIAARIRALLNKTTGNGCTEDEAISAARLAAELLAKYNLTVEEVELRESAFARHCKKHGGLVGEKLWKVAQAIAFLTDTRYWGSRPGQPPEVNFFGFGHEVEIAKYLLAICERAMLDGHGRTQARYTLLRPQKSRRMVVAYLDGMADSLSRRIRALKAPRPTGKGLMVLKDALIAQGLEDIGIKTKKGRAAPSFDLDENYMKGHAAGERVNLNRGLESAPSPKRLS